MITLPRSIRVFERGWLSSNNVLLVDDACAALVDTGYATHAQQTRALVQQALGARPLDLIVNTHLHSDHCGGNALLQATWPCRTAIPSSEADAVRNWDDARLTFRATGQTCDVLGAPGHDPHSLMLYCADERLLISADALWENGFGVIFPELEGESGFAEEQAVLEMIARLDVRVVIPGHGAPFTNVQRALESAFSRVAWLRADPTRNAKNALKVLIVFKLLEVRVMTFDALLAMLDEATVLRAAASMLAPRSEWPALLTNVIEGLAKSGALTVDGTRLLAPAV
jgi:glyoxylase-like metal-dependent hydrolase (beta-lactamase superfamily II)